jgi:hypothetical protein
MTTKAKKYSEKWLVEAGDRKADLLVELPIVCQLYEDCAATLGPTDPDCVLLNTIKTQMQAELELLCLIMPD